MGTIHVPVSHRFPHSVFPGSKRPTGRTRCCVKCCRSKRRRKRQKKSQIPPRHLYIRPHCTTSPQILPLSCPLPSILVALTTSRLPVSCVPTLCSTYFLRYFAPPDLDSSIFPEARPSSPDRLEPSLRAPFCADGYDEDGRQERPLTRAVRLGSTTRYLLALPSIGLPSGRYLPRLPWVEPGERLHSAPLRNARVFMTSTIHGSLHRCTFHRYAQNLNPGCCI